MRRTAPNRLVEFFNGKGFYIILILCVAAIGVSGYVLFFNGNSSELDDELVISDSDYMLSAQLGADASDAVYEPIVTDIPDYAINPSEVVMADDYAASVSGEAPKETGEPSEKLLGDAEAVSGSAAIPASEPSEASSATDSSDATEVNAPFFVWPVSGEVLNSFSIDELVFNSTTEDWRVHTGIDIAAPAGAHVGAIGDGVVEDVYEDEMMGWTVVINHGDGLRSVSRGLMSDITVSAGDTVKAGATIGGVGNTAELESALPSHLHLELIGDGAQIDPLEVLP